MSNRTPPKRGGTRNLQDARGSARRRAGAATTCAFCGHPDHRHRIVDAVRDAIAAGDPRDGVLAAHGLTEDAWTSLIGEVPTISDIPPLPTARGRWHRRGPLLIFDVPPRRHLPPPLLDLRARILRLRRSRPSRLGHLDPFLSSSSRRVLADLALELADYVLTDVSPPPLPRPPEELPPAVRARLPRLIDQVEHGLAPHQLRRRWRVLDLRHRYGIR